MQGFSFRSMVGEHYAVFARKWLCTATMLQHDAVSAAAESNGHRKLALAQDGQTKQQQVKDAHITKSLCRIMESQVWGPNTEPLLKPYVSDLSPNVVANVVLKQKSLAMAKQFFQWSGHVTQHNAHAYHALLMKLGEAKQFNEMWKLLHDMREKGSVVCGTTFSILLKAYGAAGLPHQALNTIKKACEFDVPLDTHVYTTLLGVLFRAKMADQARSIYKKMLEEKCKLDGSVWSTLIRGFGKNRLTKDAEKCWEQMLDSGCQPALIHFNALIEGLCESKALNKAVSTLENLQKKGLTPNAYTFNPILAALCKVGRFSEASSMFSDMRGVCAPNQATCNMLLEGLFLDPDVSKAVELYNLLEREGWVDSRSYLLLAAGLRKAKQTDKLSSVSEELHVKYGVVNVWLCNALLYCHCDQSNMDEAVSYFDRMLNGLTRPDVVSFATMINGYCKSEKLDDAMKLLSEMDGRGHKPNAFCYTPLIGAVLKAGKVADGLRLFEEMLRRGLETNAITCDVLLRNLSKAGMADESLWLCNHVIDKRFYLHHATLASLVDCLKKVGRLEKASAVFGTMEKQGCLVDGRPVEKALKVLRGTVPFETTPVGCYD